MPIRVLRLLEYTYDTPERMTDDMARWTHSCPPPAWDGHEVGHARTRMGRARAKAGAGAGADGLP